MVLLIILLGFFFPEEEITILPVENINFEYTIRESNFVHTNDSLIIKTAKNIGIEPDYLYKVIMIESSGRTTAYNKYTGAVGLIQFIPSTYKAWGLTGEEILSMSKREQLKLVERYFKGFKNLKSFTDVYLAVFYPAAIGKPNDYILGSEKSENLSLKIARKNRALDLNKDGYITKDEIKKTIL